MWLKVVSSVGNVNPSIQVVSVQNGTKYTFSMDSRRCEWHDSRWTHNREFFDSHFSDSRKTHGRVPRSAVLCRVDSQQKTLKQSVFQRFAPKVRIP